MVPQEYMGQQGDIDFLKKATLNLNTEVDTMRRIINELRVCSSEKDTEIIHLNMHLADERKKKVPATSPNFLNRGHNSQSQYLEHQPPPFSMTQPASISGPQSVAQYL